MRRILTVPFLLLALPAPADVRLPTPRYWALQFGGKDAYASAPHVPLGAAEALTIEAWIKDWRGAILCQGKAGDPENSIWISTGRRPNVGVPHDCSGFESGAGANYELGPGYGPPGRWTHLALVYADGNLKVYLQGKLSGVIAAPKPGPFDATRELILGAHQYEGLTFGTGLLGPVRISNVARYAEPFAPARRWGTDDRTLLLLLPLEGAGRTLRDYSGHGRHATIRGAEWVPAPDFGSP
jgi:hypothetical protein